MSFDSKDNQSNLKDDYYTCLGISKDATEAEIVDAYRKFSRLYHPDKHESDKKESANILFNRIKKAYEVLKDPHSRAIYDTIGEEGLDNQMYELIKYHKAPEEIREIYDELQIKKEKEQLKQFLKPRGTVTIGVDAVDLFKPPNRHRRKRNKIRLTTLGCTAAIDFPLSLQNKLNFSGLVTSSPQSKKNDHALSLNLNSLIRDDLQTDLQFTTGQGGSFLKLKGSKNLTKQDLIQARLDFSPDLFDFFRKEISYIHLLSKYLELKMTLKTDLIDSSSYITTLSYNKENNKIDLEFKLGYSDIYLSLAYIRSLNINNTKLKSKLKYGFHGTAVEYGCETRLTKHSLVDASIEIGGQSGISLKLNCLLPNQAYTLEILLNDEITFAPIVYGTIFPVLTYLCVKKYLIIPYQESIKKQKEQELSKDKLRRLYEKRRDAELSILLMKDAYLNYVRTESTKENGLIIDVAIYGNGENLNEFIDKYVYNKNKDDVENLIDEFKMNQLTLVTIPLQCLIKDSILLLPEASKCNLPGFYDTCPNKDKKLYIRYKYKNKLKDIYCDDNNRLRLPMHL